MAFRALLSENKIQLANKKLTIHFFITDIEDTFGIVSCILVSVGFRQWIWKSHKLYLSLLITVQCMTFFRPGNYLSLLE